VDGAPGAALGVMSQGEVNALALSVFLPRATVSASPFRFLIIDDPVQAMDPAKVDGLARVLEDVSRTRQVLVFTHDDRLPEAITSITPADETGPCSATFQSAGRRQRSDAVGPGASDRADWETQLWTYRYELATRLPDSCCRMTGSFNPSPPGRGWPATVRGASECSRPA